MATIRPFRALRPVPEKAHDVSSVPYDVVDTTEARKLAEGKETAYSCEPRLYFYLIPPAGVSLHLNGQTGQNPEILTLH